MLRSIRLAALGLSLLVGAPALAGEHHPGLIALLSQNHRSPTAEEVARVGPSLAEDLRRVAEDTQLAHLPRVRAVALLGEIRGELAIQVIEGLLARPELSPRLRLGSLWTLGARLPQHPATVGLLTVALQHEDPGIREQAVRSLDQVGTPQARALLQSHRMGERNVVVRTALREIRVREVGAENVRPEGRLQQRLVDPSTRTPEPGR